ncbi:uncharacterized protein MELLADRAFT_105323 [Melampsora larici-populina 98AG31]|uniref:Uncharacterized protein n=1 Tax=Melampsora larici-populina (strain 98AG31 / pathotype 3-4-7) TaxID=747676 RepID=F4RHR2_MELLP|nr:uncharacterized protein MELLADRAFT_105323 [Melampsora larici-populina 98AG31]EGG08088.1 hypothetical protein MELLADRAFT_105323 [Melampsora larici-populina 98AG31]
MIQNIGKYLVSFIEVAVVLCLSLLQSLIKYHFSLNSQLTAQRVDDPLYENLRDEENGHMSRYEEDNGKKGGKDPTLLSGMAKQNTHLLDLDRIDRYVDTKNMNEMSKVLDENPAKSISTVYSEARISNKYNKVL